MPDKQYRSVSIPLSTYDSLIQIREDIQKGLGTAITVRQTIEMIVKFHQLNHGGSS